MESPPLISLISVNYKQNEATRHFLHSLNSLSYRNIEVIIVDNNSEIDSSEQFSRVFNGNLIYIREEKNLGFAGGNNLGLTKASGDYIFFINNDTEVTPHCIQPILNLFNENPEIGIISPMIKYPIPNDLIQYAGYTRMNKITMRNRCIGYKEIDTGQYSKPMETNYAHGAALVIRREILKEVGSMSEIFFLYYEEYDLCEKVKSAGYKIYVQPHSLIFHIESLSTGNNSPLKLYYLNRNRLLFARRNYTFSQNLIFYIYYFTVPLLRDALKYIPKKKWKHFFASVNALTWNLTHKKDYDKHRYSSTLS